MKNQTNCSKGNRPEYSGDPRPLIADYFPKVEGNNEGFTRLDLLAIIAVFLIMTMLLMPALANNGLISKGLQCLSNNRQLCNAWRMYADDHNDAIPFASTSGRGIIANFNTANPNDPNNFAWSGAHMDFTGGAANRADWDPRVDMMLRPLWYYTKRDVAIYKCPSDQSSVPDVTGHLVPRIQSMQMNLYVGGFCTGQLGPGDDGGWAFANKYRIFSKTTDMTSPGPGKTFVFMDSRPDVVNWSNFMTDMDGNSPSDPSLYTFADVPGYLHDGGATFSFADGHAEIHHWTDPRTVPPAAPNGYTLAQSGFSSASPGNNDIAWLQEHSTALK